MLCFSRSLPAHQLFSPSLLRRYLRRSASGGDLPIRGPRPIFDLQRPCMSLPVRICGGGGRTERSQRVAGGAGASCLSALAPPLSEVTRLRSLFFLPLSPLHLTFDLSRSSAAASENGPPLRHRFLFLVVGSDSPDRRARRPPRWRGPARDGDFDPVPGAVPVHARLVPVRVLVSHVVRSSHRVGPRVDGSPFLMSSGRLLARSWPDRRTTRRRCWPTSAR